MGSHDSVLYMLYECSDVGTSDVQCSMYTFELADISLVLFREARDDHNSSILNILSNIDSHMLKIINLETFTILFHLL
jgi:hypothetical protein